MHLITLDAVGAYVSDFKLLAIVIAAPIILGFLIIFVLGFWIDYYSVRSQAKALVNALHVAANKNM